MKEEQFRTLENLLVYFLCLLVGIIPLVFFGNTTEFFDIPKLALLTVGVIALTGLLLFSWVFKGKLYLIKTPLNWPFILLFSSVMLSTLFSLSRFPSIFGNFPRVHGSAVSWTAYILLYFLTVLIINSRNKIKTLLHILYVSGVLLSLVTLLSLIRVYLPFEMSKSINFTPTGLPFSTSAFLIILLPLPFLSVISVIKELSKYIGLILSVLFSLVITLTGSVTDIVFLIITFSACLALARLRQMKISGLLFIPLITIIISLIFAYVSFPGNILQSVESVFPREIQLPPSISWKITAGTLRDSPLIGTGPATYLFNFTAYKPVEFNLLKYWNFTFDTAYNEIFQTLGTLGLLGFLSLSLILLIVINICRKTLNSSSELAVSLSISAIVAVLLFFFHATTLVSMTITVVIFATLMVLQETKPVKITEVTFGTKNQNEKNAGFDLLPIIIFVIFLIIALPALFYIYQTFSSDIYHRRALSQISINGKLSYEYLQKAESLNPYIDLYREDMAQINFALANTIASQKNPASSSGSLSEADKKTIQTLLSQAITEAKVGVTLSPLSSRNWSTLGQIYRNITGVAQNALTFSLDAYGRAIQRDPYNPILRLNVGGIYYSVKNYDSAIRFFTDAVNLKPDYANAYYNLAIAMRDKGDTPNAILIAQQAVSLLQKDVNFRTNPDYIRATELLSNLKKKSTDKNSLPAPAAQTQSSLTNPKLPDISVSELNNPPQLSTPAAVLSNPNTYTPQTTPVPITIP